MAKKSRFRITYGHLLAFFAGIILTLLIYRDVIISYYNG